MLGNHSLPTIAVSDNIAAVPDLTGHGYVINLFHWVQMASAAQI